MGETKGEVGMSAAVQWRGAGGDELPQRRTIEAVLATQIRLDDGSRWLKHSGREYNRGSRWNYRFVEPWTQEHDDVLTKHSAEVATLLNRCMEALSVAPQWRLRRVAEELGITGGV